MKLLQLLCLIFSLFLQLVNADDKTTAVNDASSKTDAIMSHSKNYDPPAANSTRTMKTEITPSITTPISTNLSLTENTTALLQELRLEIVKIMEHLQRKNALGSFGQTIFPEPMQIPNVTYDVGFSKYEFSNITIHGLSNFTIDHINVLLEVKEVHVKIRIKTVFIIGNFNFIRTTIPFNLTLINVTAQGVVTLAVDPDGSMIANRSVTKMQYESKQFQFGKNASVSSSKLFNSAVSAFLNVAEPHIQSLIDQRIIIEVNKKLRSIPKVPKPEANLPSFPDSAVLAGRKFVQENYEPYLLQNQTIRNTQYLNFSIGPGTIHGLSNFARVGDISVGIANNASAIKVRLITGKLYGECKFDLDFKVPQIPVRHGQLKFTVHHLQAEGIVHQSFDITEKPQLNDLELELGAVNVRLDGQGRFDILIERMVNLLPDYVRHFVVDSLEEPIKEKIQTDILDEINVRKLLPDSVTYPLLQGILAEVRKM